MKGKKILTLFLILLVVIGSITVVGISAAETKTDAQSYLDERMEKYDINGVVCVTKNGKIVCQSARGKVNSTEDKEMSIDTLFPIGSNSKQFCAVAILMLQEQGKLSVEDKLSEYFPEYSIAAEVTIKNLLTMRSGIREHQEGLFTEYTLSTDATSAENKQSILDWLYTKSLTCKPSSSHEYSNTNFLLLSIIVEQVTGQNYADFIKENIFVPLKMDNSGFYEELINHPDLAEYTGSFDMPIDPELKGLTQGCGDLVSTAADMDKWMTSLKECTLISKESISEMTMDYSKGVGYGYGIRLQDDGALFHDGAIVSYLSFVFTYPDDNFNVFGVTNDINNKGNQLANLVFEVTERFKDLQIAAAACGDVTEDGSINIKDATAIQKHVASLIVLSDDGYALADVDSSGNVNVKDATAIQKHIAGIETGYPIGK